MSAQSDFSDSEKFYRFIYVAHDESLDSVEIDYTRELYEGLSGIRRNIANGQGDPSVFYLSNGVSYSDRDEILGIHNTDTIRVGTPIVIKMNISGKDNNPEEFETIFLGAIQNQTMHEVVTEVDLNNILQILQDADFLDENNKLRYKNVSFDFFVNPHFWGNNMHEKLIAALFFILDADKYEISFNIHHMINDVQKRPEYWKNQNAYFGKWNISNINNCTRVKLMH